MELTLRRVKETSQGWKRAPSLQDEKLQRQRNSSSHRTTPSDPRNPSLVKFLLTLLLRAIPLGPFHLISTVNREQESRSSGDKSSPLRWLRVILASNFFDGSGGHGLHFIIFTTIFWSKLSRSLLTSFYHRKLKLGLRNLEELLRVYIYVYMVENKGLFEDVKRERGLYQNRVFEC